jgi:hypothetical protein
MFIHFSSSLLFKRGDCRNFVIQRVCTWAFSPDCQQTHRSMQLPVVGFSVFRPCLTVHLPVKREGGYEIPIIRWGFDSPNTNTHSQETGPGGQIPSQSQAEQFVSALDFGNGTYSWSGNVGLLATMVPYTTSALIFHCSSLQFELCRAMSNLLPVLKYLL